MSPARFARSDELLYGGSAFLSAFLLFSVQPMIAKMGVPLFGGSPGVWTICLVFFQVLLLAGYGYAHGSVQRLPPRAQAFVHLVVLVVPLAVLPPSFPAGAAPGALEWPVAPLVQALAMSVGLPFFALSTNGTFTQRWYALRTRKEPYALYAASNAGSFLALFAYPFLVEPAVDLRVQAKLFAAGYLVFVALAATCMVRALRTPVPAVVELAPVTPSRAPARPGGPLGWTLRAMVPSALLVGVSLRISTDVGSVPLIWIVPLALYLLTFILAFMPSLERVPRSVLAVPAALLVIALLSYPRVFSEGGIFYMLGPLGVLFFGSWVCHGDLARTRPPAERLTSFYLWLAVGGALGSALANLVPPLVFKSFTEYPLSLVVLAAALVAAPGVTVRWKKTVSVPLVVNVGVLWILGAGWIWLLRNPIADDPERYGLVYRLLPHLAALLLAVALGLGAIRTRRISAELVVAGLFVVLAPNPGARMTSRVVFSDRSFYGSLQVLDSAEWRMLVHGTTSHGGERRATGEAGDESAPPPSYYFTDSPMAWAVSHSPPGRIAVVGLGTGSLARLLEPGQELTYYELDPMIERMAREYFTYLSSAKGPVKVVLGDARLRLNETDERYHAIIVDAFSSDAIPVHLITEEAVRLYLARLLPDGVVYIHVSNRYLDLLPVVRSHMKELGVFGFLKRYFPNAQARSQGAQGSDVVALTVSADARERLLAGDWTAMDVERKRVRWTDARSSLLPIFRRKPIR